MSTVSNTDKPSVEEQSPRHLLYYSALGLIAGATVIAFALVPLPVVVVPLVASSALVKLLDVIAHRYSASPFSTHLHRRSIVYLATLIVATLGVLAAVSFVVRNGNALWLTWPLAGLIFVIVFMGGWFIEGRSTRKTPSAI